MQLLTPNRSEDAAAAAAIAVVRAPSMHDTSYLVLQRIASSQGKLATMSNLYIVEWQAIPDLAGGRRERSNRVCQIAI